MRWPIRNQILFPFAAVQVITLVVATLSFAWLGLERVEQDVTRRFQQVRDTLESGSYPLTSRVLGQLHELSGAHFVVFDSNGVRKESTLEDVTIPAEWSTQIRNRAISAEPGRFEIPGETQAYTTGFVKRQSGYQSLYVVVLYPEQEVSADRNAALYFPLAIGGSLIIATLIASVWIARRIARRVDRVQQHVSRIANGDYAPVPLSVKDDELYDLSESVNQMAHVIERSIGQTRESERAAMLTQLAGGLAHQFRNSLTGAKVSIQLHQRHCENRDDDALAVSLRQLELMEEQIQALMRLSNTETDVAVSAAIQDILEDIVALVTPLCQHKKIELVTNDFRSDVSVQDGVAFRGALLNLVMNAIEAAPSGGHVSIQQSTSRQELFIDIIDDGPGIPLGLRERVFQPFFTTKPEGIGIGLALAKQAALDCGGTLILDETDGQTRFRLSIPHSIDSQPAGQSVSAPVGAS